jgi:hypothetical protein
MELALLMVFLMGLGMGWAMQSPLLRPKDLEKELEKLLLRVSDLEMALEWERAKAMARE